MRLLSNDDEPKRKRDREIVALAKTGMTYEEIAGRFGLTRAMISHIAISNGVIRRPSDISPTKWKRD